MVVSGTAARRSRLVPPGRRPAQAPLACCRRLLHVSESASQGEPAAETRATWALSAPVRVIEEGSLMGEALLHMGRCWACLSYQGQVPPRRQIQWPQKEPCAV